MHLPGGILPVPGARGLCLPWQPVSESTGASQHFCLGESLLILTGVGCESEEHRHKT